MLTRSAEALAGRVGRRTAGKARVEPPSLAVATPGD
jgi:glutamate transport system permease protein